MLIIGWLILSLSMDAAVAKDAPKPEQKTEEAKELEKIKERYWAQGEEAEIGVVQNRTYSKKRKFEVGINGGVAIQDPFISVKTAGFDLGYNISEYFAVHALAWKDFATGSTALDTFERERQATTNTNFPKWYAGAEGMGSIFYGKLSVLGKMIIYYDLYLVGGAGLTSTENGDYFTPHLGIGQRFFINRFISARLDYRMQYYKEDVIEKQIITKLGQETLVRETFS